MRIPIKSFKAVYFIILFILIGCSKNTYNQLYEQATLYQEQGNLDEALIYYIKALDYPTNDYSRIAYNYYNQFQILNDVIFDWKSCATCLNSAKYYFDKCSDVTMSYLSQFELIDLYVSNNNISEAENVLAQIDRSEMPSDSTIVNRYYSAYIYHLIKKGVDSSILQNTINEYIESVEQLTLPNPILAWGLKLLNNSNDVEKLLPSKEELVNQENRIKYYECLYNIQLLNRDYKSAINTLESRYSSIVNLSSAAFSQEIQFVDDIAAYEKSQNRTFCINIIIYLLLAVILLTIFIFALIVYKKNKILARQISEEHKQAEIIINAENPYTAKIKTSLSERFTLMNKIFKAYLINQKSFSKAADEIQSIFEDPDTFLQSNSDIVGILYPGFIKKLTDHGLTSEEIKYCSLYASGLSGKDISTYLGSNSHYNLSSSIRKKLNLNAQDTNLAIYLKNILSERISLS
jgi:hypothetical protein